MDFQSNIEQRSLTRFEIIHMSYLLMVLSMASPEKYGHVFRFMNRHSAVDLTHQQSDERVFQMAIYNGTQNYHTEQRLP